MRLEPTHASRPKILLEFGGRSLLEWHALRLTTAGIAEMVVVTGFGREEVRRALDDIGGRYPLRTEEIFNPNFLEGSVLSMHASLPAVRGRREAVLLMDGDVLYPSAMLTCLVRSAHPTALLFDRDYSTADDDPVLVPIRDGAPIEFRKCWRGEAEVVGESVGFFKIGPADLPMLIEETEKRARGMGRHESYDEVLRAVVLAGRFCGVDVTGLPWTEIDFPKDVAHADGSVLPAIQAIEETPGTRTVRQPQVA
jgi:choline kinase